MAETHTYVVDGIELEYSRRQVVASTLFRELDRDPMEYGLVKADGEQVFLSHLVFPSDGPFQTVSRPVPHETIADD